MKFFSIEFKYLWHLILRIFNKGPLMGGAGISLYKFTCTKCGKSSVEEDDGCKICHNCESNYCKRW
jgi:hypothetical protein